mgnify:CR=1 FL=1
MPQPSPPPSVIDTRTPTPAVYIATLLCTNPCNLPLLVPLLSLPAPPPTPASTKSLPKATDKEFLDRVKEDIAEWENCLSSNSKLYCLKVGRSVAAGTGAHGGSGRREAMGGA